MMFQPMTLITGFWSSLTLFCLTMMQLSVTFLPSETLTLLALLAERLMGLMSWRLKTLDLLTVPARRDWRTGSRRDRSARLRWRRGGRLPSLLFSLSLIFL